MGESEGGNEHSYRTLSVYVCVVSTCWYFWTMILYQIHVEIQPSIPAGWVDGRDRQLFPVTPTTQFMK